MAIDDTIKYRMDQAFADEAERFRHAGRRLTEYNDFVSEQSQTMFLDESRKIGTREAAAMQRLDQNKLASDILQQRSAAEQPPLSGAK